MKDEFVMAGVLEMIVSVSIVWGFSFVHPIVEELCWFFGALALLPGLFLFLLGVGSSDEGKA